jgi:hypothetical protein
MVEHLSEVHLMVGCRLEDMEARPMVERHMEALEVSEAHLSVVHRLVGLVELEAQPTEAEHQQPQAFSEGSE